MRYHQAAFTGIGPWMARLDESPDEYAPSRKDVLAAWLKALGFVTLADAKLATDDMHSGREDAPAYFDHHPRCVAAIAAKRRRSRGSGTPKRINGQDTYRCLVCRDSGFVTCWHPVSLTALRADGDGPWLTCAVRCTCAMGDDRKAASDFHYDAAKWLRIDPIQIEGEEMPLLMDPSEPAQQDLARQWFAGRVTKMPNYEQSFSEFA